MKKFNLYNLTILFLVAMVTFSCVQDDEFEVPDTNPVDVNIEGNEISIADVRDLQQQAFQARYRLQVEIHEILMNRNEFVSKFMKS